MASVHTPTLGRPHCATVFKVLLVLLRLNLGILILDDISCLNLFKQNCYMNLKENCYMNLAAL
jgi:hypothetical protein